MCMVCKASIRKLLNQTIKVFNILIPIGAKPKCHRMDGFARKVNPILRLYAAERR